MAKEDFFSVSINNKGDSEKIASSVISKNNYLIYLFPWMR